MDEEVINRQESLEEDLFNEPSENDGDRGSGKENRSTEHLYKEEGGEEHDGGSGKQDDKDLFKDNEGEQEEVEPTPEMNMINYLHESGLADFSDVDFSQLDPRDYNGLIRSKIQDNINASIDAEISRLPPIVRELNEYVLAGGSMNDFISSIGMGANDPLSQNFDLENPNDQEYIVRSYLAMQGYDEAYIDSNIEFLKNSDSLKTHATNYHNQHMQSMAYEAERQAAIAQQQRVEMANAMYEYQSAMQGFIDNNNDIGGIHISYNDRTSLVPFMTEPAYTMDDGSTITEMQKVLNYDMQQNPALAAQIAILLRNRLSDGTLDLSFLQRRAETNVASRVKNGLRRQDRVAPQSSGSNRPQQQFALSDYFE